MTHSINLYTFIQINSPTQYINIYKNQILMHKFDGKKNPWFLSNLSQNQSREKPTYLLVKIIKNQVDQQASFYLPFFSPRY